MTSNLSFSVQVLQYISDTKGKICPQKIEDLFKAICPASTIGAAQNSENVFLSDLDSSMFSKRLIEEGYFTIDTNQLKISSSIVSSLVRILEQLQKHNWPASFVFMFDDAWALSYTLFEVLYRTVGPNHFNFDILSWRIDPSKNQAGFSPHRDRQPVKVEESFQDNKLPKYATCWFALTDATPDNSCLYVLPKPCDPGYSAGDDHNSSLDPLEAALSTKESYQNIRALPLSSGSAAVFSHRILHWGSKGRPSCSDPRLSLSVVVSDPSFEKPYLKDQTDLFKVPTVAQRFSLICAQMLSYHERFDLSPSEITFCHDAFSSCKEIFETTFVSKVEYEFVRAVTALAAQQNNVESENEDLLDAALDTILDAEMNGTWEGDDDFDDIESEPLPKRPKTKSQ